MLQPSSGILDVKDFWTVTDGAVVGTDYAEWIDTAGISTLFFEASAAPTDAAVKLVLYMYGKLNDEDDAPGTIQAFQLNFSTSATETKSDLFQTTQPLPRYVRLQATAGLPTFTGTIRVHLYGSQPSARTQRMGI